MPSVRRESVEVLLQILDGCENPTGPTKLMHLCSLNWIPLTRYVDFLIERGLVKKLTGRKVSSHPRARKDKRSKYLIERTVKGKTILNLTNSSEVGSLFGYLEWLRAKKRKSE